MRCLGITKSFKRCKIEKVKWYYPFCPRHHWWQPIVLIFITFPGFLGQYAGIYRDFIEPVFLDDSELIQIAKERYGNLMNEHVRPDNMVKIIMDERTVRNFLKKRKETFLTNHYYLDLSSVNDKESFNASLSIIIMPIENLSDLESDFFVNLNLSETEIERIKHTESDFIFLQSTEDRWVYNGLSSNNGKLLFSVRGNWQNAPAQFQDLMGIHCRISSNCKSRKDEVTESIAIFNHFYSKYPYLYLDQKQENRNGYGGYYSLWFPTEELVPNLSSAGTSMGNGFFLSPSAFETSIQKKILLQTANTPFY